jgi:hypothetical protein
MPETNAQEEISFIETFQMWPMYPWLPIKRYGSDERGHPKCAVIHASSLTTVIDQTLYGMTADSLDAAKRTEYESVAALVADGWIVD